MTTRKHELAHALEQQLPLSQKQALDAVNVFIRTIRESLNRDEVVVIRGLATFGTKIVKERNYRNPVDGSPLTVPEHRVVTCKIGRRLNDFIRGTAEAEDVNETGED